VYVIIRVNFNISSKMLKGASAERAHGILMLKKLKNMYYKHLSV